MSLPLLERVKTFLTDESLLTGYDVKFFTWTDADVSGSGNFICLQMAGTSGLRDEIVQRPDVRVIVVGAPSKTREADAKAKEIFDAFAGIETTLGVIKFEPIGVVGGAYELQNKRWAFEIIVRCFVEDY
jgi:hypothetical protein